MRLRRRKRPGLVHSVVRIAVPGISNFVADAVAPGWTNMSVPF
jgi:hypothetical protein